MDRNSDIVADLGFLALGTRLKRLAEQLQAGVAETLLRQGYRVLPGQLPVLMAIRQLDGPGVAQLASMLGMTQPGVSRTLGTLAKTGLVTMQPSAEDARTRRICLTAEAERLMDNLEANLFGQVAAAAADLCEGLPLLETLDRLEARNRETPFVERIRKVRP
jgi:DNA-binding MarR family transcriptional regulator